MEVSKRSSKIKLSFHDLCPDRIKNHISSNLLINSVLALGFTYVQPNLIE